MRNFILSAETACDLTCEQINKYDLKIMPMNFYINGEEYNSATTTLSTKDICDQMRKGATTKTSQPNEAEVEEYLRGLLKEGKDILHLSFSSAMSGTCETFKNVAKKLNNQCTNKIYVVDTLCQSAGVGLLLMILADKIKDCNFSITDAKDFAESIKHSIVHYFVVEDLKYLARGGRISPGLATIGNLIKLKPVLHLDDTGRIVQLQKVIGRKKSIATLIEKIIKHYSDLSNKVIICEADCKEDAEYVKQEILNFNPSLEIEINPLGPIIASHSGPGTMAVFLTADSRKA